MPNPITPAVGEEVVRNNKPGPDTRFNAPMGCRLKITGVTGDAVMLVVTHGTSFFGRGRTFRSPREQFTLDFFEPAG